MRRPVVCFDETPVQLIGETRIPWPAQPGKPARIDYEYRRNGTANLFVFLDAHQPWRHVKVTERKTAHDFRPWRGLEPVEFATLEWVPWFNHRRLLEPIGNRPPAEAEAAYHRQSEHAALAA